MHILFTLPTHNSVFLPGGSWNSLKKNNKKPTFTATFGKTSRKPYENARAWVGWLVYNWQFFHTKEVCKSKQARDALQTLLSEFKRTSTRKVRVSVRFLSHTGLCPPNSSISVLCSSCKPNTDIAIKSGFVMMVSVNSLSTHGYILSGLTDLFVSNLFKRSLTYSSSTSAKSSLCYHLLLASEAWDSWMQILQVKTKVRKALSSLSFSKSHIFLPHIWHVQQCY